MMERQSLWKDLIAAQRRPASIIAWVAILGFAANMLLLFLLAVPDRMEKEELLKETDQKKKMAQDWMNRPLPVKPTEADYRRLYAQIPSQPDSAVFLLKLKELEQSTGVALTAISFAGGEGQRASGSMPAQPKSAAVNDQAGEQPAVSASPQPAAPQGVASGERERLTQEESVSLTIEGTLGQTVEFLNRLRQLERIVAVREWQAKAETAAAIPAFSDQPPTDFLANQPVSMSVKLAVFYSRLSDQGESP